MYDANTNKQFKHTHVRIQFTYTTHIFIQCQLSSVDASENIKHKLKEWIRLQGRELVVSSGLREQGLRWRGGKEVRWKGMGGRGMLEGGRQGGSNRKGEGGTLWEGR